MADLTMDAPLRIRRPSTIFKENFLMDSSTANTIYKGQPVIIDASEDTSKVRGWLDATTLVTAADIFIGIAAEQKMVAAGALETTEIEVITDGEVGFKSATFSDADIGKTLVFTDSGTLAVGTGSASQCTAGKIKRVVDGYVYVQLTAGQFVF